MRRATAGVVALCATIARADPFPARDGETGILHVPDAEVLERGAVAFGAELAVREGRDPAASVTPVRLALVSGLGHRIEAGLAVRDADPAGPRRAAALFGAAVKVSLWSPRGALPGLAVDATLDRVNVDRVGAVRLVASTARWGPLRLAGFVGATADRIGGEVGRGQGIAASLRAGRLELVADLIDDLAGRRAGGAVRWMRSPSFGLSVGTTWAPRTGAVEGIVGIALTASSARRTARPTQEEVAQPPPELAPTPPRGKAFPTDRPRFPVKRRPTPRGGGEDAR